MKYLKKLYYKLFPHKPLNGARGDKAIKLKPGDYLHCGYCDMKILRESPLKGYTYTVRLEARFGGPWGAWAVDGNIVDINDRVVRDCKEYELIKLGGKNALLLDRK